jgi:hypothetical protein
LIQAAAVFTLAWVFSFFLYLICPQDFEELEWLDEVTRSPLTAQVLIPNKIPWQLHPLLLLIVTFGIGIWFQVGFAFLLTLAKLNVNRFGATSG